jgi:hypothetical protein
MGACVVAVSPQTKWTMLGRLADLETKKLLARRLAGIGTQAVS